MFYVLTEKFLGSGAMIYLLAGIIFIMIFTYFYYYNDAHLIYSIATSLK